MSDPWDGIVRPGSSCDLAGRLVVESHPHELFRARDIQGRRVLFLVHDRLSMTGQSLPKMAGLAVTSNEHVDKDRGILALSLESEENAKLFTRLCDDIVETVGSSTDDKGAVRAFILRTWKWHDLLKGSRRRTLSREDQLGLIGELHTLLHVLAPTLGIAAAVTAWKGTSGAPKDFELAGICIECKARGASSRAKVRITSEHQLADMAGHALVLLVHTFAAADTDGSIGDDLHGTIRSVRQIIFDESPGTMDLLDKSLDEAGYEEAHEYEVRVVHLNTEAYLVDADFPRIVPEAVPEGVAEVSYDVALSTIKEFQISDDALTKLLTKNSEP